MDININIVNKIKENIVDEAVWREKLKEPFIAEDRLISEPDYFLHTHEIFFLQPNKLPIKSNKTPKTELIISEVMFLYCDDGLDKFEESYWMCIGKTKGKTLEGADTYFMYE